MGIEKARTVLIASGGGTDARAIMEAYLAGSIPNIELMSLISTKRGEKCLEKAEKLGVKTRLIDYKEVNTVGKCFNPILNQYLKEIGVELIFLVGCIVKILPIRGVAIYNIHPADPHDFGGKGMYGLKVHERVLANIEDLIMRGKKEITNRFFTYPTVHEAVLDYDSGEPLLRSCVEIPRPIIKDWLEKKITLTEAAERLQKHVLPYEWAMLPTAVNIAAMKILNEKKL